MIKIELRNASNGVIKKVIDSSAQESSDYIKVYEIDSESKPDSFINIIDLLQDISDDLGLDLGTDFESLQVGFDIAWGEKYNPSIEEVDQKIKTLTAQIKQLKEYKKVINDNANNV